MYIVQDKNICVETADEVVTALRDIFATKDQIEQEKEHFFSLHLNTRNILLGVVEYGWELN